MSTLITGGTGFIGAEIARQAVATEPGSEIHITHRRGDFTRLDDVLADLEVHQLDLTNTTAIEDLVQSVAPERIFHFGAVLTGPGQANPQLAVEANAIGTFALLEAARVAGVRQLIFASSIGTYGTDIAGSVIDNSTIQRPLTVYGVTKVFGENLGAFYRRKYDFDFRGIRYPAVMGPGVTTPSVVQYTSWMVEEPAKGNPLTAEITPHFAVPVIYYKDAARAALELSAAGFDEIKTINYLVDGFRPTPTAADIAAAVTKKIPDADIRFAPDPETQVILDASMRPIDDSEARLEWEWQPRFDLDNAISDFLDEMG